MFDRHLSPDSVAASPLVISFMLSATVTVVTTVTGSARQNATITIMNGNLAVWSDSLSQVSNTGQTPYDIVAGEMTIRKGAVFTLSIPSANQEGSVFDQMTVITPTVPDGQPYALQVSTWPLSSATRKSA